MHFRASLFLALASGAAALAHQILWTRRLVDVLGASADTFSKVVGAFFAGLAFGAWLASRANDRRASWTAVALAELAIALLAVPMLFSAAIGNWAFTGTGVARTTAKLLLPALLVAPPAIAMGLVVPWIVRALAGNELFTPRHAVWLYAVNTFGGMLGAGLVLFVALPRLGLAGTSLAAIVLNLIVSFGALALSHLSHSDATRQSAARALGEVETRRQTEMWILAFASGFLVLGLEVLLQHQLAQVTINSLFSSAMVLVLVLLALGFAAALEPVLVRWMGDSQRVQHWALIAAALLCASQPFMLTGLRGGVTILPYELPLLPYAAEVSVLGLLAVCPMLVAAGLVFPLLLRTAATGGTKRVGLLFAWNGLGGWAGAETGQALLGPALGLWNGVVFIGGLYLVLWIALRWRRGARRKWEIAALPATGAVLYACALGAGRLPQANVARHERLAAVEVGREGVVATVECGPRDWRMLFNNSYTLGGSKAQYNQERQALLPLLLHGQPRVVATLGVATGGTVAGAALHPGVERIDAIELSPLVLEQAQKFFGPFNRDVFEDSRVRWHAEDARWVIAAREGVYDVVVGDLFLPWRTGEGRLFTIEHFSNVRRSLKTNGVFCQWLPMFQLTRPQFETIARTFAKEFPDAFLLRGDFYAELPAVALVGGVDFSRLDWEAVKSGCAELRSAGMVTDPLLRHVEGIAMMLLGPLPKPPPGPANTLGNAWLEWDAGANILGMKTPWFIGVPLAEYVRDVQRAGRHKLPVELAEAQETGQFLLTLEVADRMELPVKSELLAQVPKRLPASLRNDAQADWTQWPSRVKLNR